MKLADAEALSVACLNGGGRNCSSCADMCGHGYPGRFTLAEASNAIDAGHGARLMMVTHNGTTLLRPVIVGWEGLVLGEREMVRGRCAFLSATAHRELHNTAYKPLECRAAVCESIGRSVTRRDVTSMVSAIGRAWRTKKGATLMLRWLAMLDKQDGEVPQ